MLGKDRRAEKKGQASGGRARPVRKGLRSGRFRTLRKCIPAGSPTEEREKDYRSYTLTGKDFISSLVLSVGLSVVIAFLFYESAAGFAVILLVFPVMLIRRKRQGCTQQQRALKLEFKECIRVLTASLHAGYSVENAFRAAQTELDQLLGGQSDMCRELRQMNGQLQLNIPVESLIENLAWRSGVEEISTFGQVFAYARHNGSNFTRILKDASERITDKLELEREIQIMIAAKQLEQRIMNLIPMGILLFVRLTNPGFLDVMYTTWIGRGMMSVCLVIYGAAFLLAERIVDIRV